MLSVQSIFNILHSVFPASSTIIVIATGVIDDNNILLDFAGRITERAIWGSTCYIRALQDIRRD